MQTGRHASGMSVVYLAVESLWSGNNKKKECMQDVWFKACKILFTHWGSVHLWGENVSDIDSVASSGFRQSHAKWRKDI